MKVTVYDALLNSTWNVAKIKPSIHEEHKISVECRRNKCTR